MSELDDKKLDIGDLIIFNDNARNFVNVGLVLKRENDQILVKWRNKETWWLDSNVEITLKRDKCYSIIKRKQIKK